MTALVLANHDQNHRRALELLQMCGYIPHTCIGPNSRIRTENFTRRYAKKDSAVRAGVIDLDYLNLTEDCELHLLEVAARSGRRTLIRTKCPVRRLLIDTLRDNYPSARLHISEEQFLACVLNSASTKQ